MENKDIDKLTRQLMRGSAEEPSSSLNARIMAQILKERVSVSVFRVQKLLSPLQVIGLLVAYLMLLGLLYCWVKGYEDSASLQSDLKVFLPVILTVISGISFFSLFVLLDNWLRREVK